MARPFDWIRGATIRKMFAVTRKLMTWTPGFRVCIDCGELKALDAFRKDRARARKTKGKFRRIPEKNRGFMSYCIPCGTVRLMKWREENRGKYRAIARRHYHKDVRRTKNSRLKRSYGLTTEDLERMTAEQGGRCASCGDVKALHVDHCHRSGKVRGLLCSLCNVGIGFFRDDPERLKAAIAYLNRSSTCHS